MLNVFSREQEPRLSAANTKTAAPKKIAWLVDSPPVDPVKMIITPEIASAMMEYNTSNRPLSKGHVNNLAAEMKRGAWMFAPSPIMFSNKGRLIDGQHRLSAIVESGCAIEAMVAFGVVDEVFDKIDTGRRRTGGDVFAINGVPNYGGMAAATKWIHLYNSGFSAGTGNSGGHGSNRLTNADLYNYYLQLADLQKSRVVLDWWGRNSLPNPTVALAAHYICAGKNRAEADAFFEKVANGIGFTSKSDPAFKLREKLTRSNGEKIIPRNIFAYIIQAWNAARQNRKAARFEFDGGPLPRAK